MTTVVAAAITATLMIRCSENHQAVFKIKVAGPDLRAGDFTFLGAMKFHDTIPADTRAVAGFRWHLGEQRIRNANGGAPARAFVSRRGAELAIIRPAAQRTMLGSEVRLRTGGIVTGVGHRNQARLRRAMRSVPTPSNPSESAVGSGTATMASISDLPFSTSIRTKLMLPSATLLPSPSCAQEMS